MKTFGERLKNLIKTSDIKTNKSFCEKVNFSEQALSRIINGKNNPSFELILACMDIFTDNEMIWLLTGRDHRSELENKIEFLIKENNRLKRDREAALKLSSSRTNPRKSSQLELALSA